MLVLAPLLLAPLVLVAPQGESPAPEPMPGAKPQLLTPPEQSGLRSKLIGYLAADAAYEAATAPKDRERTNKRREKARSDFEKEWERLGKKGNLMASMADLRAVFENCFELEKPSFSLGQLRKETAKEDGVDYSFFLPKGYKPDVPCRTLVMIPGTAAGAGAGTWARPTDHFAATWEKTPLLDDSIVVVVHVPNGLELDPTPDFTREGAEAEEDRRNGAVFSGLGRVMASHNVDRARLFLDCGRGACGFGLRFLSTFPDRFAGAVLREPTAVDDIRLGSLLGMPLLLLKSPANAAAVGALAQRLEAISPGSVTVLDVQDEYPHKAATAEIEQWTARQRRNMTPARVVIEPNHDRFNRAYWVDIDRADPLLGAPLDARPRIEVTADRAANRIVVKTRGVESFFLFLNDDLVDLDKEFTVVTNDKAVVEKRGRSFRDMRDRMVMRRDWDFLFPVMFHSVVAKAADEK
ncbi:MAG: hypothetical protein KF830_13175 [Planctomycetes bacterium]|nr:hypothetical protein [Planctomycetota bacterium]